MNATELHKYLIMLFPPFENNLADSLFKNKIGTFSICGLFAELSHYVRDNVEELNKHDLKRLFQLVEDSFSIDSDNLKFSTVELNVFNTAACTCFLENLAGCNLVHQLQPYLGNKSRQYFEQWDK